MVNKKYSVLLRYQSCVLFAINYACPKIYHIAKIFLRNL